MSKGRIATIILTLVLLVGLCLLLYPMLSDYWNSLHQSKAIANYAENVAGIDEEEYERLLQAAREYNDRLKDKPNRFTMTPEETEEYEQLLNVAGNGVIGYIEIPSIGVALPIYHGVENSVLQIAIGHIEWSSLPIGGEGTHSVVSGHRGLPSAKLFTDLDKLSKGDIFVVRVLNETFTYEVDQIRTVVPDDVKDLAIEDGKDYFTLVTCTPYGINSHRLLVRGHRIDNVEASATVRIVADATRIDPLIMAPVVAIPMLLVLVVWLILPAKKKKIKA